VDDDGRLHTFPDVYGHERRITLALEGKWSQIVKGRDHLAPVELNEASVRHRYYADDEAYEQPLPRRGYPNGSYTSRNGFLDSLFGGSGGGYEQYPAAPRPYQYR
jgi:L,D-transpeptidase YcbB